MKKFNLNAPILLATLGLVACNPLNTLYKEINKMGYIEYRTPLEFSGAGTIIGGAPSSFSLMAPPEECFPDTIDGVATNLRFVDRTTLPSKSRKIDVSADVAIGLLKLAEGNKGTIGIGVGFSLVQKMQLEMSDATVEYFNAVKLLNYYNEHMSDSCKQLLDIGAFFYQVLRVGKLKYTFYNQNGAAIDLSLDKISEILDISLDLSYKIENSTSLVFERPHYMGLQLGRLKSEDGGLGLWRSSKVKKNKWVWESLNIFTVHSLPVGVQKFVENADAQAINPDSIDAHSIYR